MGPVHRLHRRPHVEPAEPVGTDQHPVRTPAHERALQAVPETSPPVIVPSMRFPVRPGPDDMGLEVGVVVELRHQVRHGVPPRDEGGPSARPGPGDPAATVWRSRGPRPFRPAHRASASTASNALRAAMSTGSHTGANGGA